jgi:RHS repeat-associated protein
LPNGDVETLGYDLAGHETSIVGKTSGGTTLTSYTDTYYKSGTPNIDGSLLVSRVDGVTGTTTAYTYDSATYLTDAVDSGGDADSWQYGHDGDGNITSAGINGGPRQTFTYNQADEITGAATPAFAATPNYDADANLTVEGNGTTNTYNNLDQLTKVTISGTATNLTYAGNANNELLGDGNTTVVGSSVLGVISTITSGTETDYLRDPDGNLLAVIAGSSTYYPLVDTRGSVVALTNSTGAKVSGATYRYDPYGNLISTAPTGIGATNPFRYNGGYSDPATGLIHYGARWYNPTAGAWTQPDPSGQNPGYNYAGSNPINEADSNGLIGFCPAYVYCGNNGTPSAGSCHWYDLTCSNNPLTFSDVLDDIYTGAACLAGGAAGASVAGPVGAVEGCAVAAGSAYSTAFPYEP